MISLCEKCVYNDWRHMQEIIDVYRDLGMERPHHIWCAATDRPEDLAFDACPSYRAVETTKRIPPTRNIRKMQKSARRAYNKAREAKDERVPKTVNG